MNKVYILSNEERENLIVSLKMLGILFCEIPTDFRREYAHKEIIKALNFLREND